MAVGFDAATESSTWTTTPDPFTFSHTNNGRAAVLYIFHPTANIDIDAMPSYGGVPFTHAWSIGGALDNEPGRIDCYFLDDAPTGSQTVSIPHNASAAVKIATIITLTSGGGPLFPVGLQRRMFLGGNGLDTSLVGSENNALRLWGGFSGLNAPASLTLVANTTEVSNHDFGNQIAKVSREDTESTGIPMGGTGSADDFCSLTIAVSETEEPLIPTDRISWPAGTTAHAFTLPTPIEDGDLLLINFGSSINGGTITATGGPALTRFDNDDDLGTMVAGLWYRECDGTEGSGVIDFVTSTATNGTGLLHMLHIPAAIRDVTQAPEATTTGPTASGTPDPAGLTPSWGAADNIWPQFLVRDANDGISSLTTNYDTHFFYSISTGVEMASSWRFNNDTSEDPGASTVGTTDEEFKIYVVAVKPFSDVTAIGNEVALVWDVAAAVGDSAQLIWDVFAALGDTVQLVWDVFDVTAVGDEIQLVWDITGFVGDQVQLVWDVETNVVAFTGWGMAI